MVLGVDPTFVLDTPDDELPIVEAILARANEKRIDYDESLAEAIAVRTANHVVPPLKQHIASLIRALARAMGG